MPPARRSRLGGRRQAALALAVLVVVAVVILVLTSSSSPPIGYDISYPQCSASYPSNPLFAIVGVNGGLASNTNPCVAGELSWARATPGQRRPRQPRVSLYIDTGDPGAKAATWPKGGKAPRYGACNGLLTNACSYLYGEQRAEHSYGVIAALSASDAGTAAWWLDVELKESWAGTYELNIAALRGFVAGLRNAGATGTVGVYSTSAQWQELTGLTAQTTTAAFAQQLADWVAGVGTLAEARQNCSDGDFTGVAPTLAQYQAGGFDADLRCG
ncbi:MAG TPA: hypothetical protein VHU61_12005 [Solirubrobacteraceae bacterium]|nr:hypothetical protein [Solirubrobacteraceae bacterium]